MRRGREKLGLARLRRCYDARDALAQRLAHMHADHGLADVQSVASLDAFDEHRIGEMAISVAGHRAAGVNVWYSADFGKSETAHGLTLNNEAAVQMLAALKSEVQIVLLRKTAQHWEERIGDGWAASFADAFTANLAGAAADDKDVVILWCLTLDHFVEDGAEFLSDIFNLKHGNPSFLFHH